MKLPAQQVLGLANATCCDGLSPVAECRVQVVPASGFVAKECGRLLQSAGASNANEVRIRIVAMDAKAGGRSDHTSLGYPLIKP